MIFFSPAVIFSDLGPQMSAVEPFLRPVNNFLQGISHFLATVNDRFEPVSHRFRRLSHFFKRMGYGYGRSNDQFMQRSLPGAGMFCKLALQFRELSFTFLVLLITIPIFNGLSIREDPFRIDMD